MVPFLIEKPSHTVEPVLNAIDSSPISMTFTELDLRLFELER